MKQQPNTTEKKHTATLKESVLSRIECEGMKPTERWKFVCTNYGVWMLWAITVVVGAIAVAEMTYIGMHSGMEFYELTHGKLTDFILDSLPYLWLGAFVVMILLAYVNMRYTKCGYRYPLWQIIVSSLVFTLLGGAVLHAIGFGQTIDRLAGKAMSNYLSVEERQNYLWEHPRDGRITGRFVEYVPGGEDIRFKDMVDRLWVVRIHELPPPDRAILLSGEQVRLLGETHDGEMIFYACGALPWMPSTGHSVQSLRETRKQFADIRRRFVVGSSSQKAEPGLLCSSIMARLMPERP